MQELTEDTANLAHTRETSFGDDKYRRQPGSRSLVRFLDAPERAPVEIVYILSTDMALRVCYDEGDTPIRSWTGVCEGR